MSFFNNKKVRREQKKIEKKTKFPACICFAFAWLDDRYSTVYLMERIDWRIKRLPHAPWEFVCEEKDTLSLDVIVPLNMHLWWNSCQTWTVINNADEKNTIMQTKYISWEILKCLVPLKLILSIVFFSHSVAFVYSWEFFFLLLSFAIISQLHTFYSRSSSLNRNGTSTLSAQHHRHRRCHNIFSSSTKFSQAINAHDCVSHMKRKKSFWWKLKIFQLYM